MTDRSIIDLMHQKIILGTAVSALTAVENARRAGTPIVIWQDGKIVELSPDDPYITANLYKPEN